MLRSLIYIAVFVMGTLAGSIFPSFSLQYEQALYARYEQVSADLAPFQEIADRYHRGSLPALIEYHLNSEDPTFHDEGVAIQNMAQSRARLAESRDVFESSFFEQALYLYLEGDRELAEATWDSFTPALVTTRAAAAFAVSIGLIFSLTCFLAPKTLRMLAGKKA